MLFSSSIFIFLFLPLFLLFYYIFPNRFKNLIILIGSLIFYTWGEQKLVIVMLATALIDYWCAILIERGMKKFIWVSLLSNLGLLAFFKYSNFAFENLNRILHLLNVDVALFSSIPKIALPIGISFYTFQTMSYTIDVYRGQVKANRNFIDFAAFVTLFPQLIAGPIVRYIDVQKQLINKNISSQNFSAGIERFIIGLSKKMLLANPCASIADTVFAAPINEISTLWSWIGIIAYAFQIYFDFSGYSDMAIGLGKMLGFDFLENFNYPYISKNIREFWRRWHISLSSWFRDYVYIPLGGSQVKVSRIYLNLLIVFAITGLWHGASWNFIVWGLAHGLFIVIERLGFDKILNRQWALLQHLYTLLVVLITWVFFRSEGLTQSINFLAKMFSLSSGDSARTSYLSFYYFNSYFITIFIFATVLSTPIMKRLNILANTFSQRNTWNPHLLKTLEFSILIILFIASVSFIAADSYNPFIYFRF